MRVDHLPPGDKKCFLRVPPTFYDLIGLTIGSGQGKSAQRDTGGPSVTLSVGGLLPGPYNAEINCLIYGSGYVVTTKRRVSVGGLS